MKNNYFREWGPIKLYPWKVMAKIAIQQGAQRLIYMYAVETGFVGYKEKLTQEEQIALKAHLIYQP